MVQMVGSTLDIKGVKVTTPVSGLGVEGGQFTRDQKALQTASDAAIQADQKFIRLCRLLPSYASNKDAFYKARDQMFDLIMNTNYVASAVASATGQTPPAKPATAPTAATDAATAAGTSPSKAVANTAAKKTQTPPTTTTTSSASAAAQIVDAAKKLKRVAKKPAPRPAATHVREDGRR